MNNDIICHFVNNILYNIIYNFKYNMKTPDDGLLIFAKRIAPKVNERDIKTVVPIVMPISKEFIGYLKI